MRDNHVFLKTLSGLERVDVILRRVDDDFATRSNCATIPSSACPVWSKRCAGNVTIANALGSGIVQSPAFMSFLPGLSKTFC